MGAILLVLFEAVTFSIVLPDMEWCEELKKLNRQALVSLDLPVPIAVCLKTRDA